MAKKTIESMYSDVGVQDSPECYVDDLWAGILREYFPGDYFQVIVQPPPTGGSTLRVDVAFWHERPNNKIIVFKNQKGGLESDSSAWKRAVEQLTAYLLEIRELMADTRKTYYAGVAIGRYVRFYVLYQDSNGLQDYEGADAALQPFEASKNEKDIHRVLTEWVGKFV